MPNLDIQPFTKASAAVAAVAALSGQASTQRVDRSIAVKMYRYPSLLAVRGPTKST